MAGMRTRNILLSCFNQPKAEVPYHNQHYYEHSDYTAEVEYRKLPWEERNTSKKII
jgi:hypothetical protein